MTLDTDYGSGPGKPNLVSVVIPTYERADLIGRAIESVLAQRHRPLEILVVDDGSTDDTERVVARYAPIARYLRQANAGVSAARNLGLRAAQGEFIALLDSDDYWLPWKLEAQLSLLRRYPAVGMVWTDMAAVDQWDVLQEPTYLRKFYTTYAKIRMNEAFSEAGPARDICPNLADTLGDGRFHIGDLLSPMLLGNLVHTSTVLLRRDRLRQVGGFDTSLRVTGEDYDFHLRTCSYGPVALLDVPSIHYRIGAADQLTSPDLARYMARNNLTTVERGLRLAGDRLTLSRRQVRRRLADSYRWVGRAELRSGNRRGARRFLAESLRYWPAHAATAALLLMSLMPSAVQGPLQMGWRTVRKLASFRLPPRVRKLRGSSSGMR